MLCRRRFNRTLIIHANVYDQDQGLTGRYHNTTLDTNQIIQALYYKPGASRDRIQARYTREPAEATISEYRHKLNKDALRRLAQKQHERRGKASCLGPPNYS